MSLKNSNLIYNLKPLSPIHIGTGEKLKPLEYFISDRSLYVIDLLKFLNSLPKIETFTSSIDNKYNISKLIQKLKINPEKICSYNILCDYNPQEVLPHIKSIYCEPYIAGSSIKGSIRTSILYNLISQDNFIDNIENNLKKIYNRLSTTDKQDRRKLLIQMSNDAGIDMERSIFNKEKGYSIMRALQISDSTPVKSEFLNISEVRVLSINLRKEPKWKNFKLYPETLISREDLPEICKESKGTIKIDDFLLKDTPLNKERLGYTSQIEKIKDFIKLSREFSNMRINREISFFKECGIKEIASWYENLKSIKLEENQFLLQIGWGTGFESKTITHSFSENLIEELRRNFGLGKRKVRIHMECDSEVFPSFNKDGYYFCQSCRSDIIKKEETMLVPFPKTRKIVFMKDKPECPLGWALMTIDETSNSSKQEGENTATENY